MAHGTFPVQRSHADAALAADPVAAAPAHSARVPELSQRPLAAGAGALAVLSRVALCASASNLLEVKLHPPEVTTEDVTDIFNWKLNLLLLALAWKKALGRKLVLFQ